MENEEHADSGSEDIFAEPELNMEEAHKDMSESLFGKTEDNPEKDVVDTEGKVERKEPLEESVTDEKSETDKEPLKKDEENKKDESEVDDDFPASWKKDMKDAWSKADPTIKAYVKLREDQMKHGVEVAKEDATMGRTMRDIMSPYKDMLQKQNINEPELVKYLMSAHQALSFAPAEEKPKILQQLASQYGVNLGGETQKVDPVIQQLQDEINGVKQHLTVSQQKAQQAEAARIQSEVDDFAKNHEYFDELSDDITIYIRTGLDLEDAYEKALWANPVTRAKENQRLQDLETKKAQEKAKQEVEAAKKAKSTNVRKRDTDKAPTAPKGTMDDTMRETYREIHNR